MTLLLMAAGSGSRYGKLKQFDALGPKQEFLMEFSIHDALKYGFRHIVVITKLENQEFLKEYLDKRLPKSIQLDVLVQDINDLPESVNLSVQRLKPWGTAHAVWTARHVIKGQFVIINADDYYGQKAFEGAANFMKHNENVNHFALVSYNLQETLSEHGSVSRGVCASNGKELTHIKEYTKISKIGNQIIDQDSNTVLDNEAIVSMNFWICSSKIFDYIATYFEAFLQHKTNHEKAEIYLPFVAQEMMLNGHVKVEVIPSNSSWFGVTYYKDKENAVETLKSLTESGSYPSPLW
jgi:NDP-sugar pyrophosphorylase family protein